MTKEEKIKEAWGEFYHKAKDFIDSYGYFDRKKNKKLSYFGNFNVNELQFAETKIRPKSLQGIETNNGWIKIESEDDLPKESGEYHVFNTEDVFTENFRRLSDSNRKMWLKLYTHYQPIEKPKPPIY